MKNTILFMICSALIFCSCSRESEPEQQSRDSLSERLEIINQAREVQKKENQATESRNKLVNDIFNKNQVPTPAE
jgi:hypothetical protein